MGRITPLGIKLLREKKLEEKTEATFLWIDKFLLTNSRKYPVKINYLEVIDRFDLVQNELPPEKIIEVYQKCDWKVVYKDKEINSILSDNKPQVIYLEFSPNPTLIKEE